jgi:hypothetical protein
MELWANMLAQEYCVDLKHARSWVAGSESRSFVVEFLQSHCWKVEAYTTPHVGLERVVSYGYVVSDDCEQFVAWRLSQGDIP